MFALSITRTCAHRERVSVSYHIKVTNKSWAHGSGHFSAVMKIKSY